MNNDNLIYKIFYSFLHIENSFENTEKQLFLNILTEEAIYKSIMELTMEVRRM